MSNRQSHTDGNAARSYEGEPVDSHLGQFGSEPRQAFREDEIDESGEFAPVAPPAPEAPTPHVHERGLGFWEIALVVVGSMGAHVGV
ncbi:MAG TPA: hypothetical protein VGF45_23585, partial [Polyangia bacterium]